MRIAATTVFIVAVGIGPVLAKGGPPSKAAGSRPAKVAHAGGAMTPKAGTHGAPKAARTTGAPKAVRTHGGPARGSAPVKTTKVSPHAKGPAKTTHGASHGKAASTHGAASAKGSAATTKATGKSAKTLQSSTTGTNTGPKATTTTASPETPVLGPNVPRNQKLQAKLLAMLPAGMTINDAAAGFKNQGQFVAAVHVSNNLGLPFTQLKTRMVDDGLSLGQAIQAVKPAVDSAAAARIGEQQAAADLR